MLIEDGCKFQISDEIKCNFNSADTLTIIRQNGTTAQFILNDGKGKGYGSMPIQHLQYLLKREELKAITDENEIFDDNEKEEQIG